MRRAALAALVFALGCATLNQGEQLGSDAPPLALGTPAYGSLKCDLDMPCEDRYALELSDKQRLTLQLDVESGGAWNVVFELIVRDANGNQLALENNETMPTITLARELGPGRFVVAVRAITAGNLVPYTLTAR